MWCEGALKRAPRKMLDIDKLETTVNQPYSYKRLGDSLATLWQQGPLNWQDVQRILRKEHRSTNIWFNRWHDVEVASICHSLWRWTRLHIPSFHFASKSWSFFLTIRSAAADVVQLLQSSSAHFRSWHGCGHKLKLLLRYISQFYISSPEVSSASSFNGIYYFIHAAYIEETEWKKTVINTIYPFYIEYYAMGTKK